MNKRIFNTAGIFALSMAALASAMSPGTANAKEDTQMAAGVDLLGQLPVGNFADAVGFGVGALGRFEYNLHQSPLAVTARAGYVYHLSKDGGLDSYSQVPLLAGLKYSLPTAPIYLAGEAGAVIGMSKADFPGAESETETNFGFNAGAGYELGDVDIRLSLNFADVSHMSDAMSIGISLGYNFWGM